ncbi:hypothetical protein, unlikely [Trypanosoma congolense IL3000]|uniref:Uncharacterized protein n=1 Tax=Trypanosoma congolense (strain IL3000) TaxID=1068625 RepID=F9W918_TRYCI|nr:hypothetical protein, unlikely [Trypanosoma congolense IL3000]
MHLPTLRLSKWWCAAQQPWRVNQCPLNPVRGYRACPHFSSGWCSRLAGCFKGVLAIAAPKLLSAVALYTMRSPHTPYGGRHPQHFQGIPFTRVTRQHMSSSNVSATTQRCETSLLPKQNDNN